MKEAKQAKTASFVAAKREKEIKILWGEPPPEPKKHVVRLKKDIPKMLEPRLNVFQALMPRPDLFRKKTILLKGCMGFKYA